MNEVAERLRIGEFFNAQVLPGYLLVMEGNSARLLEKYPAGVWIHRIGCDNQRDRASRLPCFS